MAHASRVSDSVNLPSELPTNEARPEGSNASPNSHIGKCSTVQHHMNLVQAPTHEEIAKIVQNIVNAHMPEPDHKTWTVPSTSDCMDKVLTCQTCEYLMNEMCGAVICDACESACHLRCLQFNSKPISGEDWHCLKCAENSNGKLFPLKYGRVVRIASKPEMSSSTA
ncbi:putative bromo adjacent homology domain, zinc finger, RING/FYVE/PHD-type containing protein [Tanacetum coccineum]